MTQRPVVLLQKALRDLESAYRYAAQRAPAPAKRWLERFETALDQLGDRASGCPLAPESARSPTELRQMLFGRKPNVFRVIYFIADEAVYVARILRAQRRFLTRQQIRDAIDPG